MSKKLTYCMVINKLERDEDFIEAAIDFLNKVNPESAYSASDAITELLDYWLSNNELTCYQHDEPILNEEITGGIVYGDSDKSNDSLHQSLKFDSQELINKLKSEGFDLPDYLKEQEEFLQICLKEIDWKDWISRKHILIYEALLLLKEIDPAYFEDPDQFDEDDEFVLQIRQWIEDKAIKPQVTFIDGGQNEYRIEPVVFFNLARLNSWPLPHELLKTLDEYQSLQCNDELKNTESTESLTEEQTELQAPVNTDKISHCFVGFKNLHPREIALVMMENETVTMFIRKKSIIVNPNQLGLKHGQQGWKLIRDASIADGILTGALKALNKTRDREKENQKIKTAISRLNDKLTQYMGLQSQPIIYESNVYRFIFKSMKDQGIHGIRASKGDDAMDQKHNRAYDYDSRDDREEEDEDEYD